MHDDFQHKMQQTMYILHSNFYFLLANCFVLGEHFCASCAKFSTTFFLHMMDFTAIFPRRVCFQKLHTADKIAWCNMSNVCHKCSFKGDSGLVLGNPWAWHKCGKWGL